MHWTFNLTQQMILFKPQIIDFLNAYQFPERNLFRTGLLLKIFARALPQRTYRHTWGPRRPLLKRRGRWLRSLCQCSKEGDPPLVWRNQLLTWGAQRKRPRRTRVRRKTWFMVGEVEGEVAAAAVEVKIGKGKHKVRYFILKLSWNPVGFLELLFPEIALGVITAT